MGQQTQPRQFRVQRKAAVTPAQCARNAEYCQQGACESSVTASHCCNKRYLVLMMSGMSFTATFAAAVTIS
jgi:hypothetical protein